MVRGNATSVGAIPDIADSIAAGALGVVVVNWIRDMSVEGSFPVLNAPHPFRDTQWTVPVVCVGPISLPPLLAAVAADAGGTESVMAMSVVGSYLDGARANNIVARSVGSVSV
jgi:hypothetical protein